MLRSHRKLCPKQLENNWTTELLLTIIAIHSLLSFRSSRLYRKIFLSQNCCFHFLCALFTPNHSGQYLFSCKTAQSLSQQNADLRRFTYATCQPQYLFLIPTCYTSIFPQQGAKNMLTKDEAHQQLGRLLSTYTQRLFTCWPVFLSLPLRQTIKDFIAKRDCSAILKHEEHAERKLIAVYSKAHLLQCTAGCRIFATYYRKFPINPIRSLKVT